MSCFRSLFDSFLLEVLVGLQILVGKDPGYSPLLKILTAHKPAVFMSWKDRIGWLVHTHMELLTAREGSGSNKQKLLGSFELKAGLPKIKITGTKERKNSLQTD